MDQARRTVVPLVAVWTAIHAGGCGSNGNPAIADEAAAASTSGSSSGSGASSLGSSDSSGSSGSNSASAISAGNDFACALLSGGSVKCWGRNITTGSPIPVAVSGLSGVTAISAGYDFACALLSDGHVECWGDNEYGELGNGTTATFSYTPVEPRAWSGVKAISAGSQVACAILSGSSVACWGVELLDYGDLGNGTTGDAFLSGVTAVSVGVGFACALLSGGSVQCWGYDDAGQLGTATNWATNSSSIPVAVSNLSAVTAISASKGGSESADFACALLSDGSVQCWGAGSQPHGTSRTRFFAGSWDHPFCRQKGPPAGEG